MARLQLALLGGFQARREDGSALTLPTRKAQALLAFLALPAGRAHQREKLAALLWGDMADAQARGGLRQALSALRKAAGDSALILEGDSVALDRDVVEVDVRAFEGHLAADTPDALARAAALYRGDLLDGVALREAAFEAWLSAERDRVRELALGAFAKLLRHQQTAGATEAGLATALQLLALDPLQETVHRALMRLYVERGRRGAALRQYQLCVSALARELGVEPEAATKELYQQILRQRPAPPATPIEEHAPREPGRSPWRDDDALPRDVPLVGRESEMQRVRELLRQDWSDGTHVVAVVGEAGIGKSRLTAELAAEASARDGRVLVGRTSTRVTRRCRRSIARAARR